MPACRRRPLNGTPITAPPEAVCRAGIAGTFQLARIPDALDARDNVAVAAMYGRRRRLDVAAARAEAERLLARVGFEGDLSARGDALPYFDLKRIELARRAGLCPRPAVARRVAGRPQPELEAGIALAAASPDDHEILMVEHVMHAIRSLCGYIVGSTPAASSLPARPRRPWPTKMSCASTGRVPSSDVAAINPSRLLRKPFEVCADTYDAANP